jgi:hypothetical protein
MVRGLFAGLLCAVSVPATAVAGGPNPTPARARSIALAGGADPTPAQVRGGANPTVAQMRAALRQATHSAHLWATVNICEIGKTNGIVGIRGQMPALGFPSRLYMVVQVQYWDATIKHYMPVSNGKVTLRAGQVSTGFEQDGHSFPFARGNDLQLRGTVTFQWRRSGKLLGSATRATTAGHRDAQGARPQHYSAATCTID